MSSELTDNSLKLNNNEVILSVSSGVISVTFNVEDYNSSKTYTVGDYVYNSSKTYICRENTPSPAGSFNSAYWEER